MVYERLYVFSDKDHPKRGKFYGRHFRVVGSFKDIRHVIWGGTGEKGYVRVGEFVPIQEFNGPGELERLRIGSYSRLQRAEGLNRVLGILRYRLEADSRSATLIWANRKTEEMKRKTADNFVLEG